MSQNPQRVTLKTQHGNILSLSPEFYFQLIDQQDSNQELLHLGKNGRLIIRELTNIPYKLAFVWRTGTFEANNESSNIKHIVEFIPDILQRLPANYATHVCLFLIADKAMIFITRLQEIIWAKLHSYSTPDDLLYHLVNSIRLCNLKKENVHLTLCGDIMPDSAITNHLSRYFSQISCKPLSLDIF